mgnify:CR=1 FL=1
MEQISFLPTFASWRAAARRALQAETPPAEIAWEEIGEDQPALSLFEEAEPPHEGSAAARFRVPKRFLALAKLVALHRNPCRWPLLYRLLWRLTHGETHLLEISVDPDVAQANDFEKSIRHDLHKMRAFVRFRDVEHTTGEKWFVARFEPAHQLVEQNAPFFAERFARRRWSVLAPERMAPGDGKEGGARGGGAGVLRARPRADCSAAARRVRASYRAMEGS